jgi:hypothetical protein
LEFKWIDGAYFDQTLAGVQAPDPAGFPRFVPLQMDGPDGGMVHKPEDGWKGECYACGKKGHVHSECPANRWKDQQSGKERVNARWLFEKGLCDGVGEKK